MPVSLCLHSKNSNIHAKPQQDKWQLMNNAILGHIHVTTVAVVKQELLHILSVCLALGTWHAMCMHCVILSTVVCLALKIFFNIIS